MATFRLAPVLKLRKHREEDRKRDLAAALTVENREKETALRYAELRQSQTVQLRRSQQTGGEMDIRTLIEHRSYIGLLDRELSGQLRRVAQAEHETGRRRGRLAEAMVARKALDVLRDKAAAAERAETEKAEATELDEVAVRIAVGRRAAPLQ
jgi:flagellar export protein FliJ